MRVSLPFVPPLALSNLDAPAAAARFVWIFCSLCIFFLFGRTSLFKQAARAPCEQRFLWRDVFVKRVGRDSSTIVVNKFMAHCCIAFMVVALQDNG